MCIQEMGKFWKADPGLGSILDKPNLHRLMELYRHTIPAHGHAKNVSELVFETAHRPLKRCVSNGNNRKVEMAAVEHCLDNDWQSRLALLQPYLEHGDDSEREKALRELPHLIVGRACDSLGPGLPTHRQVMDDVDRRIKNISVPPVLQELRSGKKVMAFWTGAHAMWVARGNPINEHEEAQNTTWNVDNMMSRGKQIMSSLVPDFSTTDQNVWAVSCAAYDVLRTGMVVQALIGNGEEDSRVIVQSDNRDNCVHIFVVIGILDRDRDGPWAVVWRTDLRSGLMRTPQQPTPGGVQVLLLTEYVRRATCFHRCTGTDVCKVYMIRRTVVHSEQILSGGTFTVRMRKQGYPPRMA